jgi:hypothetical protein
MKFNCFFLMPVIDTFPMRLREELEVAYEADLDAVFDVAAVRSSPLRTCTSSITAVYAPHHCAHVLHPSLLCAPCAASVPP